MLRRPVRQTQKSGAYMNAVVEDITLGYATVRLAKNGARLTRLPVLGGAVTTGEHVIVDWSAGVPPLVRPITTPWEEGEGLEAGLSAGEGMDMIPTDVSFHIYGESVSVVPKTSWLQVPWGATRWQTHGFYNLNDPSVITIPFDGFYFITAQAAAVGFADIRSGYDLNDWSNYGGWEEFEGDTELQRLYGELRSSSFGVFGYHISKSMDMYPTMYNTIEVSGMVPAVAGDQITFHLQHTDPARDEIDLVIDEDDHLFPRIWGMRMTQGGYADAGGYSYGTTGSSDGPGSGGAEDVQDDSDIEISTNMGYLHVSEQSTQTYARGIAYVGDWLSLELLLKYRFDDVDGNAELRIFLRSTRDWLDWETPTRAYGMYLSNTGGWGLHRVEGESSTLLDSKNTPATTVARWLRFRADGLNIKGKTWFDGESEPGWDLEIADTGGFTDLGGFQLGYFNRIGTNKVYLDDLNLDVP